MKKKLYLVTLLFLKINCEEVQKIASADQSELAEESFLKWKSKEANISNENIDDSKIHCISTNAQETMKQSKVDIATKAEEIANQCRVNNAPNNNAAILKLINKVVEPDVDLIQWLEKKNTNLAALMNILGRHDTATHKNKLNAWAFYFLTAQATNIALSFIKKEEEKSGKKFDDLDLKIKEKTIGQATPIIAKIFIKNIKQVAKKFKFEIPKINIQDVEPIIYDYLKEKFI